MKNEAALQSSILDWLRGPSVGGKWENRAPSAFGSTGVPDITGCFRGRSIAIELKNPNDHHEPKPTDTRWPGQRKFLRSVFSSGGIALGCNNFEAVRELIIHVNSNLDASGVSIAKPYYAESWL